MYNLIIRSKQLIVIPSNKIYARKDDKLVGKFKSYSQAVAFLTSIPEGFGINPLNNVNWLEVKAAKFSGISIAAPRNQTTAKSVTSPKPATRRLSYEEMEDMGMGHATAEGFMKY
jgi:hypothetical protein